MYCLDTNIVIDLFRGDSKLQNKIQTTQNLGIDISLTLLSLTELFKGAYQASKKEEALELVKDFSKSVTLLNLTEKSCDIFGHDAAYLKKKGQLTFEFDLLIASVAKTEGKIFVTRNEKHFKNIPNLKIEVW